MSDQALRARYQALAQTYWHHTIQLFPDVVTKGGKSAEILAAERAAILGVVDLAGRSVIDVGTWNGYFAFEAKRAGAGRVIATDSFVWHAPIFRGRETFDLARDCLGLDVEAREIDPTDFPGDLAPADVVLFLGVFYHLIDPIMVLQKMAATINDLLVVETHLDLQSLGRPAMVFYPGTTLNNDGSNWWGPNSQCVAELLAAVGFPNVFYQHHPEVPGRGIFHAFRTAETARRYLRRPADNTTLFDLRSDGGKRAIFRGPSLPQRALAWARTAFRRMRAR
jgi:tRNA (mo5U34)-methyltransferase